METLQSMLDQGLLTEPQFLEIRAWFLGSQTRQQLKAMPDHLWRALYLAHLLMEFDPESQVQTMH